MPGRSISLVWRYDPTLYAPAKYRRACRYEAFVPDALGQQRWRLDAGVAGVAAEAEAAIRQLNATAQPALAPLARLLLRTESIASSRVEGMQLGARQLARAESLVDSGGKAAPTALEILANINAMEVAIEVAAHRFSTGDIVAIHRRLMEHPPNSRIAGQIRSEQNWVGGNAYNPCGADFVPPPPEYVAELLADLCAAVNEAMLPPWASSGSLSARPVRDHPPLR